MSFSRLLALSLLAAGNATAEDFSFDSPKATARDLASRPHQPAKNDLADYWKNLTYDQHRDIRFKMEAGLWGKEKLPFFIDFFHPGWTTEKTLAIHAVMDGRATPLIFDRGLFDYGKQTFPGGTPPPPGYAGWRARYHLNSPEYMDEFLFFLGASYLRAIPGGWPCGLSAHGLSINSGLPGVPGEFPDFTRFCLHRPVADAKSLTAWALMDGESLVGAYPFTVTPGAETVIDVNARMTLRRPVQQQGLAPFSSKFWCGEGTHPRPYDFRPEVQDSDGLLMELASGNLLYCFRWFRDPAPSGLFTLRATRCGNPVQQPDKLLMTVDFAKPLHPEMKTGDPEWDDFSKLNPVVAVNQKAVKLIHAGLSDLSMAHVDDIPAGLGRSPQLYMPRVIRAFFVLEPPQDIREIDTTCELHDDAGKTVSERWA